MDSLIIVGPLLVMMVGGTFLVARAGTRDVPDDQRVAVVRAGTFQKLAGPGKAFVVPLLERAVPLAVDDVGTALDEGRAQFGGADVPIRSSVHLEPGDVVRIIGFDRSDAAVVLKA